VDLVKSIKSAALKTNCKELTMRLLFCDSGFSPKEVDYMYQPEYDAAKEQGISSSLISFEALKKGQIDEALQRVPPAMMNPKTAVYRGWMMNPSLYQQFYDGLLARNIQLINSPEEYVFCHYLPNSYSTIEAYTPKSIFKPLNKTFDIEDYKTELKVFGNKPIIVKDYVKSQKHYWEEACFIPNASDLKQVEQITKRFIELQDVDLNEGIVYREFVDLQELTQHSKSGMPLTKEFRLFVKNGQIISSFNYWDEGDYGNTTADFAFLEEVIPKIKSNFFSIDIAQKVPGEWVIVELGDGQVSGLPDNANKVAFYEAIK